MAKKVTVSALKAMVEELLNIAPVYERFKTLEKQVKDGLVELNFSEVEIPGLGRVFVSTSERVKVTVPEAVRILGEALADKVIVIHRSVSNDIIKALVQAEIITPDKRDDLMATAEKTPVVNLYIRPLK